MTAAAKGPRRIWAVTIDTDWVTALLMAALLIICGRLLARDIHGLFQGQVAHWVPLHRTFIDIFTGIFEVVAAVYCFLAALRHPANSVKFGRAVRFAFVLVGIRLTALAIFGFFHTSLGVRHTTAIVGTIIMQVSLIIFCVAIADWFRSVVHWTIGSAPSGGASET
jgi:hypothetical protein